MSIPVSHPILEKFPIVTVEGDVLFDILTKQIEKTPYEVLTTKYITIKRIYDISCDMLEEHFKNNPNQKVKYKRFRNKTK